MYAHLRNALYYEKFKGEFILKLRYLCATSGSHFVRNCEL